MSLVFEGKLVPYFDYMAENTIDYNTRIYRLVTDSTHMYVTKIAATGYAFPISVSIKLPTYSNCAYKFHSNSFFMEFCWFTLIF